MNCLRTSMSAASFRSSRGGCRGNRHFRERISSAIAGSSSPSSTEFLLYIPFDRRTERDPSLEGDWAGPAFFKMVRDVSRFLHKTSADAGGTKASRAPCKNRTGTDTPSISAAQSSFFQASQAAAAAMPDAPKAACSAHRMCAGLGGCAHISRQNQVAASTLPREHQASHAYAASREISPAESIIARRTRNPENSRRYRRAAAAPRPCPTNVMFRRFSNFTSSYTSSAIRAKKTPASAPAEPPNPRRSGGAPAFFYAKANQRLPQRPDDSSTIRAASPPIPPLPAGHRHARRSVVHPKSKENTSHRPPSPTIFRLSSLCHRGFFVKKTCLCTIYPHYHPGYPQSLWKS